MNRQILPNKQTVAATYYFSHWLCKQMEKNDVNAVALARYVGCERKSIYDYCAGRRYPKLDVLAKIFAYFDKSTIIIPLTEVHDENPL